MTAMMRRVAMARRGTVVLRQRACTPPRPLMLPIPPAPGVSARRVSRTVVLLAYRLPKTPARCRVVMLEATLDVNDDRFPGHMVRIPIERGADSVEVPVPPHIRSADVVRVRAVTRRRAPSEAAVVRID